MNAEAIVPALARTTTGAQAERVLRDLILDGALEPGTRLRETQLAASLGVSRNTLREALRGLTEQGLVTHHPHRGVVVTDLTEADVADLYALRHVVELAALRRLDAPRVAELHAATDAFADALEHGDAVAALECDFRFHRILVGALGSARLAAAHERAQGELRLALLQLDREYEPPAVDEHRAVVRALEAGDIAAADAALAAQLDRAARRLQSLVRVKESEPPVKGATP
jgi:DNA-binding GntR family transcriptional regulator